MSGSLVFVIQFSGVPENRSEAQIFGEEETRRSATRAELAKPEKERSQRRRGPVVQLVRTPPCHGGGQGFESPLGRVCWLEVIYVRPMFLFMGS